MAARTQTVVRARTLIEQGADDIPTGPIVEVISGADRILAGGIVELVRLELADLYEISRSDARHAGIDVVKAQTCRVARSFEGVRIGRAECPLPDVLRGAGEYAIARTLIEGLFCRCYFPSYPLVISI